jgi:hypothetical protein
MADEQVDRGEFGGIIDASGREVLVYSTVIDDRPGVQLVPLSMGDGWRTVVTISLCEAQLDELIAELLRARSTSSRELDRDRFERYKRTQCQHPVPINITTLGSPNLQYQCNACGGRWEEPRDG